MSERFLGRKAELEILQKKFDSDNFCMTIIYGRRRIGKTMLVNEFMKSQDCRKIAFTAVEQNEKALLAMMTNTVLSSLAPEMIGVVEFPDFDRLFEFVGKYAEKERIIFFIDEYPYLVKQCKYIQSILQKHIDTDWKNANLFFILCGSLIGFMKDEVLAESAPLFGRSNLELKLRPFGYYETALFLNDFTNEEKAITYGLTGGVAKYIEQFDDRKSLDSNIIELFFSLGSYFSEEQVKTVISSERKNPAVFNSIISAVATGHTKNNEISVYSGSDDITYPLKVLVKSEILEKRISKKPYYILNDSMLEFWFRYANSAVSLINAGNGEVYYNSHVKDKLHDFMGRVFEKMAKEYLYRNAGTGDIPLVTSISDYQNSVLGDDGQPHQVEIDLCGTIDKKTVLIGECKFKNAKVDRSEFESFLNKVNLVKGTEAFLCMFSLSGFTEYVIQNAKDVRLITLDDMY